MSSALEAAVTTGEVTQPTSKRRSWRVEGFAGPVFREAPAKARHDARVQLGQRLVHVPIAIALLVLLAPLMLVIAALVKLTSPGPVIYKQTRVGLDRRRGRPDTSGGRRLVDYGGRLFTIYKFRTMSADPNATLQIWATPNDPRVTPIGRILRASRLDELPQLFNVVRGDMNLVGPRPEQPNIVLKLAEVIDDYPQRQQVLPGITGWAQINHHYDRSIEDVRKKLGYDLEYVRRPSLLRDLKIMALTVPVILFQKGAW